MLGSRPVSEQETAPEVGFTAHLWGGPFDGTTLVLDDDLHWDIAYVCETDPLLPVCTPFFAATSVDHTHMHIWSHQQPCGWCYRVGAADGNVFRFRASWPD